MCEKKFRCNGSCCDPETPFPEKADSCLCPSCYRREYGTGKSEEWKKMFLDHDPCERRED